MDRYVTGDVIRALRERKGLTQEELAQRIYVSGKAVSKWETGKGYPDVSLLEPLAAALGISVIELLSGQSVANRNRCANMLRGKWYVCPVCGNVIRAAGEAVISCCGVTLPPLEPETPDEDHQIRVAVVENEYFVSVAHPMAKDHHISFLAAVSDRAVHLVKLYPEEDAQARFPMTGVHRFYAYCNRHGLYEVKR